MPFLHPLGWRAQGWVKYSLRPSDRRQDTKWTRACVPYRTLRSKSCISLTFQKLRKSYIWYGKTHQKFSSLTTWSMKLSVVSGNLGVKKAKGIDPVLSISSKRPVKRSMEIFPRSFFSGNTLSASFKMWKFQLGTVSFSSQKSDQNGSRFVPLQRYNNRILEKILHFYSAPCFVPLFWMILCSPHQQNNWLIWKSRQNLGQCECSALSSGWCP